MTYSSPADDKFKVSVEKAASHDEGLLSRQALIEALETAKPLPWSPNLRKLYGFCVIASLCSSMNGLCLPSLRART